MTNTESDQALPLTAHLLELRNRILRSLAVIVVIFLILFAYANELYTLVATPLIDALPEGSTMIATEIASPFMAPFKMTLVVAVFISIPYVLYQIWGFIAPGLFKSEKRLILPLLVSSVILFYIGVAFAYFAVFPTMFSFFSMATPEGVAYTPDITKFLDIAIAMFFAFGIVFEIPIATLILIHTGITTSASLAEKRPYIIVGCFVVSMFLTPPDVASLFLMAIPMCLLFEIGVFFGRFIKSDSSSTDE